VTAVPVPPPHPPATDFAPPTALRTPQAGCEEHRKGAKSRWWGWGLAVALVVLGGCGADPPLQQAAPPDPPAACVLDTTALADATHVTWTPDQATANDTRCVYDAGPNAATPAGPAFLTVSLFNRTQADPAAERESLAQLCVQGSRVDLNKADGGFVCRFDGDLVYGALVRGDQVVQVATSAIPRSTASAALSSAITDQLANLPAN
jgi:hypothetical protein